MLSRFLLDFSLDVGAFVIELSQIFSFFGKLLAAETISFSLTLTNSWDPSVN